MNDHPVTHDERTDAVIGMGCRLAFMVLSFGVLIIAAVRAWAFGQLTWDLIALYFVSNCVLGVYQYVKRAQVVSWRWFLFFGLVGAVFAVAITLLRQYF